LGRRRYSIWSAAGVAVALAVGMDAFEDFLAAREQWTIISGTRRLRTMLRRSWLFWISGT